VLADEPARLTGAREVLADELELLTGAGEVLTGAGEVLTGAGEVFPAWAIGFPAWARSSRRGRSGSRRGRGLPGVGDQVAGAVVVASAGAALVALFTPSTWRVAGPGERRGMI
jgi:hypothetical protein